MSITLQAAAVNQLIVGGVTIETDAAAAVTGMSVDWVANTITYFLKKGTVAGAVFTPGQVAMGNLSVTINATTGAWSVDGSGQSGTLSGGALTTVQTNMKAWRNQLESFSNTQAIVPGTLVAW